MAVSKKVSIKKSPSTKTVKSKPLVGVIGLGIMGSAMSYNLLKHGFSVVGYDPNPKALANLKKEGGQVAKSAQEVALLVDFMILSLPGPGPLMACAQEIAKSNNRNLIIAETSTLDPADKIQARDILQQKGITLLDCPLSGTGAQARNKDLSIYSSGPKEAVKKMEFVFSGFTKAHYYLGKFGNGMQMKFMANLLVAIHNVSTAEALLFGANCGIDPALATKVLSDGAGGSRMLDIRGPVMAKGTWAEATMKVSTWQKDMKLITEALAASNTPAPTFVACQAIYNAAMGAGHADHDTAAVYAVLKRMSSKK
jgi:3-hydroxyisobutyrate dehydrogenase-like beta-hydroxyacid dehydrogenase